MNQRIPSASTGEFFNTIRTKADMRRHSKFMSSHPKAWRQREAERTVETA
jgi:hypothetical protein